MTTIIERADSLWNIGQRAEAIQILEDFVPSACAEITIDSAGDITYLYRSQSFSAAIEKLRRFHYACAQYADPETGDRPCPEVRIQHLSRILELGFRFGYILKFLAEAHHDLGDDEQARVYLTQAWEVDPNLSGAVRISRALGLSIPTKRDECADISELISLISPKWTHARQLPTETEIRHWVDDSRWDLVIEFSNPAEYSHDLLPRARNLLRLIAISLGEGENNEDAREALSIMLSSYYWDVRDAAITSLSKIGNEGTLTFLEGLSTGSSMWSERLSSPIAHLRAGIIGSPP